MSDLISRAAVLEELADLYWTEERFLTFKDVDGVFDRIKALPSAPDEEKISDLLYDVYRLTCPQLGTGGVAVLKSYISMVYREIFGEEGPEWMR